MKYMIQSAAGEETGGPLARLSKAVGGARKWSKKNYLSEALKARIQEGGQATKFVFKIQLYQNEQTTFIEKASREWKESDAPFATVAELEIPNPNEKKQDKSDKEIEKMVFSPLNTQDFKPLNTMNEACKIVYDQSAEKRGGCTLHAGR